MSLNVKEIKKDFPILQRKINDHDLIYLDNAATSQKPQQVIDALVNFYSQHNANINRGVHTLGDEATDLYSAARVKVANFIGARKVEEIVFTKNSTEGLNLVAGGWGLTFIKKGDVVLVSSNEHNSSLLPWREICLSKDARLEVIDLDEPLTSLEEKIKNTQAKVLVFSHASNVLGTIFPVKEITNICRKYGVLTVIDGSQALPHIPVNVQSLGCDFYIFSAHKMLGPMGVGVLWGRYELLEKMNPVNFGGGMVLSFDLENPEWKEVPDKFEAGTPDVAGVVGLGVAIDYLEKIGMNVVREHEISLTKYALDCLQTIEGLEILGPLDASERTGLVSFTLNGIHSHDVAAVLNAEGIAVRSGMHCAMHLHKKLEIPASTRASFYLYNDNSDVDKLVLAIGKAKKLLQK